MEGDNFSTKTLSVPKDILNRCWIFKYWQLHWFVLHYGAGVVAVIAGGFATVASTDSAPLFIREHTWMWGLLASLLSGLVTFLDPLQKAQTYKQAYYMLSAAITRYEVGNIPIETLLDAYEKAQNKVLLGDGGTPLNDNASAK